MPIDTYSYQMPQTEQMQQTATLERPYRGVIPESDEVRNYTAGQGHDGEFAQWEDEIKNHPESDFVLGYDELDPDSPLFNTPQTAVSHEQVAEARTNEPHTFTVEMAQHSVEQGTANLERLMAIGTRLTYERHEAESN